jgi:DNA-binding CsgD family transcriptional regulator
VADDAQSERGQPHAGTLTARERQIVALLAAGLTGAQIAGELYLSPETVRTHIRNAMARLGASTRTQAVALAIEHDEIPPTIPAPAADAAGTGPRHRGGALDPAMAEILASLGALHDLDGVAVFGVSEDGMMLSRIGAHGIGEASAIELPQTLALGEGPLGKLALERRAQFLGPAGDNTRGGLLGAPIHGGGRLLGVLALAVRTSRPTGRSELLLLGAYANRVGEIIDSGHDTSRRLATTTERFRASWVAATRSA